MFHGLHIIFSRHGIIRWYKAQAEQEYRTEIKSLLNTIN